MFGKNGFNVSCFDISNEAIEKTKAWAEEENLSFKYAVGDMLNLPYGDDTMDCILCLHVISHTDTEGMRKVVNELKRVLKKDGECYLTLGSKDTWGYKQPWPMVDENTKLRMEEGPEYKIPHFYADYDLIQDLFKEFKIEKINHIGTYYTGDDGKLYNSYHYHVHIIKM